MNMKKIYRQFKFYCSKLAARISKDPQTSYLNFDKVLSKYLRDELIKYRGTQESLQRRSLMPLDTEWLVSLDKMITSFDLITNQDNLHYLTKKGYKDTSSYRSAVEEGLSLFSRHLQHMWF